MKFRRMTKVWLCGLMAVLMVIGMPVSAMATQTEERQEQIEESTPAMATFATDDIASGTDGTVDWRIDKKGVLYIGGGEFEKTGIWSRYRYDIKRIVFTAPVVGPESMNYFFAGIIFVAEIVGLDYLDTSNVTSMAGMFSGMEKLKSVDVSCLDTSNVTDMSYMFDGVTNLTSLNLSNFDTRNVTNMRSMFWITENLNNVDFRNATFDSVTSYQNMMYVATVIVKSQVEKDWLQSKFPSLNVVIG